MIYLTIPSLMRKLQTTTLVVTVTTLTSHSQYLNPLKKKMYVICPYAMPSFSQASTIKDPIVEYEDEFGRIRTARRSEVPRTVLEQQRQAEEDVEDE